MAKEQFNSQGQGTSRRDFLRSSALTLTAASLTSLASRAALGQETPPRPLGGSATGKLFVDTDTAYGKVQGIQTTGIKEFKGVPYGASTGGRNRFMPPKKPAPWKGVRECLALRPGQSASAHRFAIRLRHDDSLGLFSRAAWARTA